MSEKVAYIVVEVALDTAFRKKPIEGSTTYANTPIEAVYLQPRDASHALCPVGSIFNVHFGDGPAIMLTETAPGYDFECGMDGGIYVSNSVALPGSVIALLIVFSGPRSANNA